MSPFSSLSLMTRETIDSMREAVLSLDRKGAIIILNPAAETLPGARAGEAAGHGFAESILGRKELEPFNHCIQEAIHVPPTPHVKETDPNRPDAGQEHLVARANPLGTEDGRPRGVAVLAADLSRRVRLPEKTIEHKRLRHQLGQFFLHVPSIFVIGVLVNHVLLANLEWLNVFGTVVGFGAVSIPRHFSLVPGGKVTFSWLGVVTYYVHSFWREPMGRGVSRSPLERFCDGRKGCAALLLTGIMHILFCLAPVAVTFPGGLVFGAFHQRRHDLIGVSIPHGTPGIFTFTLGQL